MSTSQTRDSVFHAFMNPDELAGDAAFFVRFLDTLNGLPAFQRNHERERERLGLRPGTRLLDVGCGTATFLIESAPLLGDDGKAVGLDQSDALLGVANNRAAASNVAVELHVGDAMALPFADDAFDAVRSERLLQYLPDAVAGLREMARVIRPGGRIAATEIDWDTFFNDIPDVPRDPWRRAITVTADNSGNPWMGRQLERAFRTAGITDVQTEPFVVLVRSFDTFWHGMGGEPSMTRAVELGAIDQDDLDRMVAAMRASDAAGHFLFGVTGFSVFGTTPK